MTGRKAAARKVHRVVGIFDRPVPSLPVDLFQTLYPAYLGSVRIFNTRLYAHLPFGAGIARLVSSSTILYGDLFSSRTSRYISCTIWTSSSGPGISITRSDRKFLSSP